MKTLLKMQTTIRAVFIQQGDVPVLAEEQARKVVVALSNEFGGKQIYFPKMHQQYKAVLHHQIIENFSGSNHNELAKKHNLSVSQIYNITKDKK